MKRTSGLLLLTLLFVSGAFAQDEPIDFQRAQQIMEKARRGERVTPEERAYVDRAQQQMRQQRGGGGNQVAPFTGHLTPLTELGTAKYKGEDGGLYGGGSNEPPASQLAAAMKAVATIQPLDAAGKPAKDGKIGLLSVGMSNTTQEFSAWVTRMRTDRDMNPSVVLVDGAQGARTSIRWADANSDVWPVLDQRLSALSVTNEQIQVIWMKQAEGGPARLGEFPKHAEALKENLIKVAGNLHHRFPNVRVIYLSSRIYAGYANTQLNPEPYAYESAFTMRWLIQDQIAGKSGLKDLPVLLWGPYLWADGETPRKADKLTYSRTDLDGDGTHPSRAGREKVADLLTTFFKENATTKSWFLAKP